MGQPATALSSAEITVDKRRVTLRKQRENMA
jgi:hypothetical protein